MDQCSICRMVDFVPVCSGEDIVEPKGKVLSLLVDLYSYTHLWSQTVGCGQKKEIPDTSS